MAASLKLMTSIKSTCLIVPITKESIVTIRCHDQIWMFSLPSINDEDHTIQPHFLKEKREEDTIYCVVIYCEQVYAPIWSGKYQARYGILQFAERVVKGLNYFLFVLESGAIDFNFGIEIGPEGKEWEQFLTLLGAFSDSMGLKGKLIKQLQDIVAVQRVDRSKIKMLLEEVLAVYFLPHELFLVSGKSLEKMEE